MNRLSIIILTLLAALACNPDMFIEPLTVSESKFVMPFTGGAIEVQVGHGDWEIERVALNHIDCGFVTDDEGNMRHESNFTTFKIARPQRDKLVLTVEDMSNSSPMEMEIYISNPFQSQVIYVYMEPCTGYEFDRIDYGELVVISPADAYEEAWRVTEVNETVAPVTKEYEVFGATLERTVWFPAATVVSADLPYVSWYETLMEFVTGPFSVPIPDALPSASDPETDQGTTPETAPETQTIPFTYDKTIIPTEAPEAKAEVTLMPGENAVIMYWGYVEYTVPYTMWFKHADGGRPRFMTGEFTSRAYDGRWRTEVR